jgi:phosphoribosylanthranilate isomerase
MSRRLRVKICGLTRVEDARLAVELGADAVGFILWPTSPRFIEPERAAAIARALPPFVARVGVFVNSAADDVRRTADLVGLHAVQLHGDERAEEFAGVGRPVMKAVSLSGDEDVRDAVNLPPSVTVLVDAVDREKRGGTGRRADWDRAAAVARVRPIVLAGGLSADTVEEAVARVAPWAIDVSSGVEDKPGLKSAAKLRALFDRLRSLDLRNT